MKNNDLYYELNYINANNKDTLITSIYDIKKRDKGFYVHTINNNDIDSINKDSPIHLLRALYTCKSFAICKENGESFINKDNAGKILGYKSNFANIFIFGKDSLSDEYLQARKDLYKSVTKIREERQSEYEKERERISNLTYEEYQTELKDKQRQARLSNNKDSYLLESQDKNNIIIFLDKINPKDLENKNIYSNLYSKDSNIDSNLYSNLYTKDSNIYSNLNSNPYPKDSKDSNLHSNLYANLYSKDSNTDYLYSYLFHKDSFLSLSNLLHIHNGKIDIFTKDNSYIDIQELANDYKDYAITLDSLNSPNTQIFLYSHLLLGGTESPNPTHTKNIDKEALKNFEYNQYIIHHWRKIAA